MVIIHAHMKIKETAVDTFLENVKTLVAGSQAEAGNISYSLYRDVNESNSFIMVEVWSDTEAIKIHNNADHYTDFMAKVKDMVEEPPQVNRYTVSE